METNPCPLNLGSFGLLLRPKSFIHKYFSSTDYISRWNLTTRTWKISFHIVHGSYFLPPAYIVCGKIIFSVMAVCLFTGGADVRVVVVVVVGEGDARVPCGRGMLALGSRWLHVMDLYFVLQ